MAPKYFLVHGATTILTSTHPPFSINPQKIYITISVQKWCIFTEGIWGIDPLNNEKMMGRYNYFFLFDEDRMYIPTKEKKFFGASQNLVAGL